MADPEFPHMVSIGPPLSPIATPGSAASERVTSTAGANLTGASNPSRVADVFRGIARGVGAGLEAIGSGVRRAFEGIGNLFRSDAGQCAPAATRALVDHLPLTLESGEITMTSALPKLVALLQPDTAEPTCAELREAYRTMGAGINSFFKVLKLRPDCVDPAVVAQVKTLANPQTVIAGGESKTLVWERLQRNSPEDNDFLKDASVRSALLAHVVEVRDMAASFMAAIGEPGRAARIDALGRLEASPDPVPT